MDHKKKVYERAVGLFCAAMLGCAWLGCAWYALGTKAAHASPPKDPRIQTHPQTKDGTQPPNAREPHKTKPDSSAQKAANRSPAIRFTMRSLRPYLASDELASVRRLLAKGSCQAAKQASAALALQASTKRALQVRLGHCFFLRKMYTKARTHLASVQWEEIDDHLRWWQAESWRLEGDQLHASKAYLGIPRNSRFYKEARLLAAKIAMEQRQWKRASDILQEDDIFSNAPTAWWLQAQAALQRKTKQSKDEAMRWLKRLLVEAPASGEGMSAQRWLGAGGIRLSLAEKTTRASHLNRHFAYKLALSTLDGAVISNQKTPKALRCRFYYTRGFAWFRLRRYRSAIPDLQRARVLCQNIPQEGVLSLYRLAQSHHRLGSIGRANLVYRELAQRYPQHYLADDAIFTVAELLDRSGRSAQAKATFASLQTRFPKGDMVVVAQWRLAYQAYRKGEWPEAQRLFTLLLTRYPKSRNAPAALYFSARAYQKAAKKLAHPQAKRQYLRLVRRYPLQYYSFLAIARLEEIDKRAWRIARIDTAANPSPPSTDPPTQTAASKIPSAQSATSANPTALDAAQIKKRILPWGPMARKPLSTEEIAAPFEGRSYPLMNEPIYRRGRILYRLGLLDDAAAEWMRLFNCRYFQPPSPKPRSWRCGQRGDLGAQWMALHFHLAGRYHLADRVYRRRGTIEGRLALTPQTVPTWYLAYPRPYWPHVKNATAKEQVSVALAYGLMREESTFDPNIQSWANAYGLMQLLFSTAKATARGLSIYHTLSIDDLYRPSVNIRLGVRHLRILLRQFQDKLPMTIAGYNAGSGWVSRWLRRHRGLPLDEWIEAIHIRQTRHYVKRVLQSYAIYRLLYGLDGESTGSLSGLKPWWQPGSLL